MKFDVWRGRQNVASRVRFETRIDRMPYQLSGDERSAIESVLRSVMGNLGAEVGRDFVERLWLTPVLLRMFAPSGQLAGFANVLHRNCAGRRVQHVMTVYVADEFRGHNLMTLAFRRYLYAEARRRWLGVFSPLYVTGVTGNPQILRALARKLPVYPDLEHDQQTPSDVVRIAEALAAEFYPMPDARPHQALIQISTSGVHVLGSQSSGDDEFDRRFFELADPKRRVLVLFVVRIRFRDSIRNINPWYSRLKRRANTRARQVRS
jgi:hypothetical protein